MPAWATASYMHRDIVHIGHTTGSGWGSARQFIIT